MDPDLSLVLGLIIGGFSIPSIMSAISDSRAPRASMLTILIAGGLILYGVQNKPGGVALAEIPDLFVKVIAQYLP